jgi:flagellar basal-body rod modification protein FlgD
MSTISSLPTGSTSLASVASSATGSSELNKDTFLKLLTTQLQNQDPLNPMNNEEFVAQLAQFSSLEQLQGVNSQLENLNLVNTSMNNASMVNLMGQDVVAASDTFHYDGEGGTDLMYNASESFSSGSVVIRNEDGTVVDTIELSAGSAGEQTLSWDGTDQSGQALPEGNYTFSMTASNENGDAVAITTLIKGTIDEMAFENGVPQPSVNGVPVSVGNIIRLIKGGDI